MNLIGNTNTKEQIQIALDSARKRNMALPHMLFAGSAGCGKTSMAREVAKVGGVDFISVSPENIKDSKDVRKLLDNLNHDNYDEKGNKVGKVKPSIIFVDEIHKLVLPAQEDFGIAMEDFMLPTSRPNRFFWLPYFTLIGATTLAGNLSKPFYDRFKIIFDFRPYDLEDSCKIVKFHAQRIGVTLLDEATVEIANRSRGVPRLMVRYLERIRDFSSAKNKPLVTPRIVANVFNKLGIDAEGFTNTEIAILKALYVSDKPIGLENIAIITNESARTIKDTIEPYLIQRGFIIRSGAGRLITRQGREYLDAQGYTGLNAGKIEISANYKRN